MTTASRLRRTVCNRGHISDFPANKRSLDSRRNSIAEIQWSTSRFISNDRLIKSNHRHIVFAPHVGSQVARTDHDLASTDPVRVNRMFKQLDQHVLGPLEHDEAGRRDQPPLRDQNSQVREPLLWRVMQLVLLDQCDQKR